MKRHLFPPSAVRLVVFCLLMWGMMTSLMAQAPASNADSKTPAQRKAAVFVFTREPKVGVQQAKMLEDLIATRVAKLGFATLTRDVVVDSISKAMKHPGDTETQKEKTFLEQFVAVLQKPDKVEKSLEDQLDEQSSMMRLAQTIGADLIIIATTESFGTEKRIFKGNELAPVATKTIFDNLLVSYRLAFASSGGAVAGDTVKVTRAWRESDSLTRETDDLMNGMFDEAAGELAKKISAANDAIKEVPKVVSAGVVFNVCPALPGGAPLQLPTYETNNVKLTPTAIVPADVLVDGVSAGTLPASINMATGLHQIAVQAEGYKTWKRFVNVSEGQKFNIQLEMTEESYEKWKDTITFLSDLSRKTKLTDAEVNLMEAKAKAMQKGGLLIKIIN